MSNSNSNNLILFTLSRTNNPAAGEFSASYNGSSVVIANRYGDICHPIKDNTQKAVNYINGMGFSITKSIGMLAAN